MAPFGRLRRILEDTELRTLGGGADLADAEAEGNLGGLREDGRPDGRPAVQGDVGVRACLNRASLVRPRDRHQERERRGQARRQDDEADDGTTGPGSARSPAAQRRSGSRCGRTRAGGPTPSATGRRSSGAHAASTRARPTARAGGTPHTRRGRRVSRSSSGGCRSSAPGPGTSSRARRAARRRGTAGRCRRRRRQRPSRSARRRRREATAIGGGGGGALLLASLWWPCSSPLLVQFPLLCQSCTLPAPDDTSVGRLALFSAGRGLRARTGRHLEFRSADTADVTRRRSRHHRPGVGLLRVLRCGFATKPAS